MGFPNDPTYYNPTSHRPKEDTMTANIHTIAELDCTPALHYVPDSDHPFILTIGDAPVVGFTDRDHAARALQDIHALRAQTDLDGRTTIVSGGEIVAESTYTPFAAVEAAVQRVATDGRRWLNWGMTFDPDMVTDDDEQDGAAVGDICTGADDDLFITTPGGQWQLTISEALRLSQGLTEMIHHVLNNPWSNEDRSTILSRGTEKAV